MMSGRMENQNGDRRLFRVLGRVSAAVLLAVIIGFFVFVSSIERKERDDHPRADGIVVLTGGADRIEDGLRLLERGLGRRMVISGVNVQTTMETLKKRWPGRAALFDCCIDLDYQARNTFGNAVESARWMRDNGFRSLVLVTAGYHMPRALVEFESAMPEVAIHPYPVVPEASHIRRWWQDAALVRIMVLEYIKYSAATLRTSLHLQGR